MKILLIGLRCTQATVAALPFGALLRECTLRQHGLWGQSLRHWPNLLSQSLRGGSYMMICDRMQPHPSPTHRATNPGN
ncbi:hypothetical protein IQ254_26760 [Nodosilinea sp. LEGE 07088]|uniref:hypothetical protein n=1 Tax=Nodosilinea sp. LEGE 07088 TaxID=2777968 RepID=UPI001880C3BD|nr:hypothetical protein [Nodosilinea sp. LEGE 07088]MBE9140759.1 hypothetical protein [Nodosilinea sp. LEGE 07088]